MKRRASLLLALMAALGTLFTGAATASAAVPAIRHVFIIVLENESAATTFGANSPAPYLAQTLRSQGAYLPNYYGVGHNSNDNYIAMISGQAPNVQNQGDCQIFDDMSPGTIGSYGQAQGTGCVYPTTVPTIASQLTGAGFTWRDYNEQMGNTPSRESSVCGHPGLNTRDGTQTATAADNYATRHNPFVYFHAIIDDTTLCDTHVVNLSALPQDLSTASGTANYTFITPDLCDDGHDAPCADGSPGGLPQADAFLKTWVPRITSSAAYKQNGLLLITFDEAATSDTSSCCGEIPGPGSPEPGEQGPGGGKTGAVLLSPCIKPGTVSDTAYNHYSMLGSVENLFGLSHIGYAGLPGESYFGSDIFTAACGATAPSGAGTGTRAPPSATVRAPTYASQNATAPRFTVRWGHAARGSAYRVQVRTLARRPSRWRTLRSSTRSTSLRFAGTLGRTYQFRVAAIGASGLPGAWGSATTVVPSGARPAGGRFSGHWTLLRRRGAWAQRVMQTTSPGSALTLRFRGGTLALIGDLTAHGGVMRVLLDGHSHTVALDASRLHRRRVIFRAALRPGAHRLQLTDVRGLVALEGVAVTARG